MDPMAPPTAPSTDRTDTRLADRPALALEPLNAAQSVNVPPSLHPGEYANPHLHADGTRCVSASDGRHYLHGQGLTPDVLCPAHEADARVLAALPDLEADGYGWPDLAPSTILEDAQDACYGDRQGDYGHPREDFTRQAVLWTGLLQHKLADGEFIAPEDIARCMVATKLARDVHSPKRDNRVDGAGYFLCLDRLESGK